MRKKSVKLHGITSGVFLENFGKIRLGRRGGQADIAAREGYLDWSRFYLFYLAAIFVLLLFLGRLFNLTVIAGEKNRELSENNRIRIVEVEAERGKIFDRRGRLLAYSQQKYFLKKGENETAISPEQAKDLEAEGLAGENFEGDLGKIYQKTQRIYPLSDAVSHVLGYTSIVSKEDLQARPQLSFFETVGRLGVEASYDSFLRGKAGKKLIEVDVLGRNVSILGSVDSVAGRDIKLTIDADLQKIAYSALVRAVNRIGSRRGAVVIQNPKTGEVLALASAPGYNGEDIGRYVSDLDQPFFNRATVGTYPPGSIFKIVSALAALESGELTENTEIEDVGEFELGGSRFANWYYLQYGKRDGILKIDKALARSNDIFFYRIGEMIGLSAIRQMAIKLGFGQETGIDLPGESYGLVPDEVWKKATFNQEWFLGDTLHLSIGQGFMLATPVQINLLTSFMATGHLTKPYLVARIDKGAAGEEEIRIEPKISTETAVDKKNYDLVRTGMREACETGGTGWPFFNAPYKVGCKTGTAERALGNPHAWFTAFAPYDAPKIAITVVIEDGGEGSSVAGPVAREILDWLYAQDQNLNIKN